MRRLAALCGALVFAACGGGQTTVDPCVMRVDITNASGTLQLFSSTTVNASTSVRSGKCSTDRRLAWESSKPDVIEVVSSTETSAVVRAKKVGNAILRASLIVAPEARDSITFDVPNPPVF